MVAVNDTMLMTGHEGPEVNSGDMLVTPTGSTQKRLADALALSNPGAAPTYATLTLTNIPVALTDVAAKALGVPIGGLYRTASTLQIRVT